MSMRRALLMSTGDRYAGLVVSFASVAAVSRLLTPQEIGLMAIGMAVTNFVEILRDSGTTSFVIQSQNSSPEVPRTAFTLMALLTLVFAVPMVIFAVPLAGLYGDARLAPLLEVLAVALLPGPLFAIPFAMMRREMAFTLPTVINIANTTTISMVTIALAFGGFGYLSAALGLLVGNWLSAGLLLLARRDLFWVYRLSLARLRDAVSFGGNTAVAGILLALNEFLPNLYLSRLLGMDGLGYYNRSIVAYSLPDKLILMGLIPVALPAFTALARDGHNLRLAYLRGLSYLSAVKWPVHILVAILAEPIVHVLLGPQWQGVVPLVQILSLAALINFPYVLTWPVLVAAGAVHLYLRMLLIAVPLSILIMAGSAQFGLKALIWGHFPIMALFTLPTVFYVRRAIGFGWLELARSVSKSLVVTAASMAAPILAYVGLGHISVLQALVIVMVAGAGWLAGLRWTRHALLGEVHRLVDAGLALAPVQRQLHRLPTPIRAVLVSSAGRKSG